MHLLYLTRGSFVVKCFALLCADFESVFWQGIRLSWGQELGCAQQCDVAGSSTLHMCLIILPSPLHEARGTRIGGL